MTPKPLLPSGGALSTPVRAAIARCCRHPSFFAPAPHTAPATRSLEVVGALAPSQMRERG
eukprot:scaffold14396_cov88-Isochrysis_galbana.AAC.1